MKKNLNHWRIISLDLFLIGFLVIIMSFAVVNSQQPSMPTGFTYLDLVCPTIQKQIRYSTDYNFVGQIVDGYLGSRVICTIELANALKEVENEIQKDGYHLVIYDTYRPQKAVDNFVTWGENVTDIKMKPEFYPHEKKSDVFIDGYIATKSGHTRGSTVDLTIISEGNTLFFPPVKSHKLIKRENGTIAEIPFLNDGTVDMFSSFDLFDEVSHGLYSAIPQPEMNNRLYLKNVMEKHGFNALSEEWWHFTLQNEPFPQTYFDFDVRDDYVVN